MTAPNPDLETHTGNAATTRRARMDVRGAVQGVGFRPFACRLARAMELAGFVRNTGEGATLEVEGTEPQIERFHAALVRDLPAPGFVRDIEVTWIDPAGAAAFVIAESAEGDARALVLADQATCEPCLREMWDPADRRYLYPFINCTHCGPRYTIIERLPYDRRHTTMAAFTMCPRCQAEYDDPESRRYHAQPNACPECGPQVRLVSNAGKTIAAKHDAITLAVAALRQGEIVAAKGIGGFHLLAMAGSDSALGRLRRRKERAFKPFAVMVPSPGWARTICELNECEMQLLESASAPIVLATRRPDSFAHVVEAVAPANPDLGIMLPHAPLQHILMRALDAPVVATSGNLAEEPICTDDAEAMERLRAIADVFLVHDRVIARPCDDSIVRVMAGEEVVLRRGRGYAPLPVVADTGLAPAIAVGAHQKNALAIAVGGDVLLSQHIGDLDSPVSRAHEARIAGDLLALFHDPVTQVVCDLHPDYGSTLFAEELAQERGMKIQRVQHHAAHLASCMADNDVAAPCLGIVWDGAGLGSDGTQWGGEFLLAGEGGIHRVAHLRAFPLVGGDAAARDGRRAALGVLHEAGAIAALDGGRVATVDALSLVERRLLTLALEAGVYTVRTSSAGRLFDAVASLLGICQRSEYEGHAASMLEFAARLACADAPPYPLEIVSAGRNEPLVVDWRPAIHALLAARDNGESPAQSAARFHATLVEAMVRVAQKVNVPTVALSGGCFQNPTLLASAVRALEGRGFRTIRHRQIPPNDGGIAAGQLIAAQQQNAAETRMHHVSRNSGTH